MVSLIWFILSLQSTLEVYLKGLKKLCNNNNGRIGFLFL